ncbi:MAG TPA: methyltransferase domain-containing protein [Candidatus Pacearchaeota archaeon]|nr:methyltransferase domain-containing protein [Candidatus Pacearchaeota archaeon]
MNKLREPSKKINVGSGKDIKPKNMGWINLDIHNRFGAECIFDLNKIFQGKKIPFKDNTFSYTLCSHVLEDFIDPVPIMDELVRITKPGGRIDIRVPYETTTWDGIFHKRPFNVITFLSYLNRESYENPKMPLRIEKVKFYTSKTDLNSFLVNPLFTIKRYLVKNLFNLMVSIKKWSVDYSFVKYFSHNIYLKVIYIKTKE